MAATPGWLASHRNRAVLRVAAALGLAGALAGKAWAIPSPELAVGTATGLSQLVALVSAALGGGAFAAGRRAKIGQRAPGTAAGRAVFVGAIVLLVMALAAAVGLLLASRTQQQARLEATLIRPTPKTADGMSLDPALKEIPYADQLVHPRGLSTADAERIAASVASGEASDWLLLDIRETAETELGSLPRARKIRFPDLPRAAIDLTTKKALLFCHNGNRSAETCARLAAQGIDCRFIIGGLEKWLAEGRFLEGDGVRKVEDLRALPGYPNDHVLLDTAGVRRLVTAEGAMFVDVRYLGEFVSGHLPGAVSLPLRPTPSTEITERIAALPRVPLVAPCYDRRSCFYAEVLGLELTRAGRDYRGRYTLPWEYFDSPPRPPHVESLLAQSRRGAWDKGKSLLADALTAAARSIGLPLAIALLALISRLAILPFSLKSERDSLTLRALKPEVARLKALFADDPPERGRALMRLYRRHKLSPLYNAVALLFLPLLALSTGAVTEAAGAMSEPFHWWRSLKEPDATLAMPSLFAVLVALYLDAQMARTPRQRLGVWLIGAPVFGWAASLAPAAVDLYILTSASLLVLQSAVTGRLRLPSGAGLGRFRRALRSGRASADGLVSLDAPDRLHGAGNKALRLALLRADGLPVPRGVVALQPVLARYAAMAPRERRRFERSIARRVGAGRLAVRSSAVGEDGAALSFAGVYESVLDVAPAVLGPALEVVAASFGGARAEAYGQGPVAGGILVQAMVKAEFAGVLFTEDPSAPGCILVELVAGTGDALVSGRAAPQSFRFGRISGIRHGGALPPIPLNRLLAFARQIEARFGQPQDIEWCFAKGRFTILQARDITTSRADPGALTAADAVRAEWRRLAEWATAKARPADAPWPTRDAPLLTRDAPLLTRDAPLLTRDAPLLTRDAPLLTRDAMTELLPCPSAASLSLLEAMWEANGSVDRAARALGLEYAALPGDPPLYVTVLGRLYLDNAQWQSRAPRLSRRAQKRLGRLAQKHERGLRGTIMPAIIGEVRLLEATDFDRLPSLDLVATLDRVVRKFVTQTHVELDQVNILAKIYLDEACTLARAAGLDPAPLLEGAPMTALNEALRHSLVAPARLQGVQRLEAIGHRASLDYELAEPRYRESPAALKAAAETVLAGLWEVSSGRTGQRPRLTPKIAASLNRARRYQCLKEDMKHHGLRELAVMRALILAIDRRFDLDGHAFALSLPELVTIEPRTAGQARAKARSRAETACALQRTPAPAPVLRLADIECGPMRAQPARVASAGSGSVLAGTRVAGAGSCEGRARVMSETEAERGAKITGFTAGDILVAPMIHPNWLAEVMVAGGVVAGVGGWLSHMAIVAREHQVAMIVGVARVAEIPDGTHLRLEADGSVEIIATRPHEPVMAAPEAGAAAAVEPAPVAPAAIARAAE